MKLGRSYKQHGIPAGAWDTIVIGSGLGGLACAGMLARHAHQRVLVLERHYTAGGFTHTFTRPGYEWDVGVHYVGDVHRPGSLLRRIFDHLSDGALVWEDMGEVYDKIVFRAGCARGKKSSDLGASAPGDDEYDFVRGRSAFRARMHDYFPRQKDAIDRYLERIRETVGKSKRYFLDKALPPRLSAVLGAPLRWPALRESRRTVREVLGELTDDPRLRGVLAGQYGDYGLPPGQASWFMHALLVGHYLGGGAYPVGGSSRIAATILPGIERAGGAVITNAEVARVIVEGGRAVGVRLAGGEEVRATRVISDAGRAITYGKLVDAHAIGVSPTVPGVPPSFGHLSLYVGCKRSSEELGLGRANHWVYPDHDHDANVARFVADPDAPMPVTYLSFPSAKDPDFARRHPGRATIEVIGVAPWEWFARWQGSPWKKRGDDYETFKRRLADRLTEALIQRVPSVAGAIDHAELSTPLTTAHFAGHPHGEIYGLSHAPARFEARDLRPHTPVRGLYLTGADVCTAGVGGALMGGLLTATVVSKKNLIGAVVRAT